MIIDSPIISGSYAASGSLNQSGDVVISGSLTITGGITGSISGSAISASFASNATSASYALTSSFSLNVPVTASYANNANSASFATTASNALTASYLSGYVSPFPFTGSAIISGSLEVTGSANIPNITGSLSGSLNGTASYAVTASNAVTASYLTGYVSPFPFTGSAIISGSLGVSGSLQVTNLSGSGVRYLVADESGSVTAQSASAALKSTQAFTSTAGQTTFSVTNGYSTGYVDVFINGSKLNSTEFTDTSGTNIVLATGSFSGDVVEVVKYTPAAGVTNNVLRQLTTLTGSAGQTVFSASYTPGLLDIFYNGSRLSPSDFTANNGTFFTLATGSAANDILDVLVYSYQVGAFSGIGGVGTADQIAFFGTTNSITGSPNFTISGSTMLITGSLTISGSSTFTNIGPAVFSGSLTSTAGFTGSFSGTATSASFAANAELLDGLDSTVFTLTSSFAAQTSSFTAFTSSILSYTASQNILNGTYATTGSNTFTGIQTVNSNLVVTGSITAQTLVVQTITSSVDFVTGSTRFGSILANTHVFSGSVTMNPGGLFVSSSGNVGIGTSSNLYGKLSVEAAGNHITMRAPGATAGKYWALDITTANQFYVINNAGTQYFTMTDGGNFGIGTPSPSARLHVANSAGGAVGFFQSTATNGEAQISIQGRNSSAVVREAIFKYDNADVFRIGTSSNIGLRFETNDIIRLTLANNGAATFTNTSSALSAVTITSPPTGGNVQLNLVSNSGGNTSYGGLNIVSSTGKAGYLTCGDNSFSTAYYAQANCVTLAATAGASMKFRVDASDTKGITITSGGQTNLIHDTTNLDVIYAVNSSASPYGMNITFAAASPNNTTNNFIYLADSNGLKCRIVSNGNIYSTSTSITIISSDIRLKTDIRDYDKGLAEVLVMKPRIYKRKNNLEVDEVGFIAQEIDKALPGSMVESYKDEDGESINTYKLEWYPLLVKAIQEQQALITALEEKLERNNII
jgi:hypothetical protein